MKRQIRRGVFETNSSSTHSVSICNGCKLQYSDIPKDSEIVIDGSYYFGTDIFDELGKLNFVVTMLASIVERNCDDDEMKIESFDEMVNLNWFKWLAEVVKTESNTDVIYKCPTYYDGSNKSYYPYYDTTYDENESIGYIFTEGDDELLIDEEKFKERVKDIIYNREIVIEDKENEY